jgi:ATP-dependent DNA helicase RecG
MTQHRETKAPAIEPRTLMERAVEVMTGSVDETRDDGKVTPAVGAVLVKPDGVIDTASRGELRDGDHAEYTLLERKNRASRLDGSTLFVTLEPCAPGSRGPGKMSCAERIVAARIKAVWVGVEDPDPTVDRKGIAFLEEHGVEVRMFDRDLQEQIVEVNKDFIRQAIERADRVRDELAEPKPLSDLELQVPNSGWKDLSQDALEVYRSRAGIDAAVRSKEFAEALQRQGLLSIDAAGVKTPTGFGVHLFAKFPREFFPNAGVLGLVDHGHRGVETREFDEPLAVLPESIERWIRDKLPIGMTRTRMQRRDAIPFELVREGVINAIVHRDYGIAGAKVQIEIDGDVVTIDSPGAPVRPITLEQMQSFTAPMLSRNPPLHYAFARMGLAEEQGLGLRSMKEAAERSNLPAPEYSFREPYLRLTLYLSEESGLLRFPAEKLVRLTEQERRGLLFVVKRSRFTRAEYEAFLGVDSRTAQRQLKRFTELGLIMATGSGRSAAYAPVQR